MDTQNAQINRRIRFSAVVIVSQILLIALSLAWGIYLITIAMNGGVLSVENNPWVLFGEIFATFLIIQFAMVVIFLELYRMRVRRHGERTARDFSAIPNKKKEPSEGQVVL